MLDAVTEAYFVELTRSNPENESRWYGPWIALLGQVFPPAQGYIVRPQMTSADSVGLEHKLDFVLELVKIVSPPFEARTVLIVEIKNTNRWPKDINRVDQQLERYASAAFDTTARDTVYCISSIGPHWRLSKKEDDGQGLQYLTEWHSPIHDKASFDEFVRLKSMIDIL